MKTKLAVLCLLASSNSIAKESGFITGFNYTKSLSAEATATFDVSDFEITEDLDISTLGLYLGYINKRNNRFTISYSSTTIDFDKSNANEDVTGFDFDWQFVYGEDQIQPYWGIGFGLHTIDEAIVLTGSNIEGDSLSGLSFQMMGGAKIKVNEQVELDLSIQRKAYAWESVDVQAGFATDTVNTSYVQNAINFGAGFKF